MTDSKLVAIPPNDWLRLRNLYRQNWPANLLGFYTVDTFLRWQEQETEIKHLIIYSLDGDWEKDGTYVCIVSTDVCSDGILCLSAKYIQLCTWMLVCSNPRAQHRYQLFANTLDASLVRLERMLHLLDWSRGYKVSTLLDRFRPAVQTVIDTHQYSLEFDSRTFLYYLPQEMAIELDTTYAYFIYFSFYSKRKLNMETIAFYIDVHQELHLEPWTGCTPKPSTMPGPIVIQHRCFSCKNLLNSVRQLVPSTKLVNLSLGVWGNEIVFFPLTQFFFKNVVNHIDIQLQIASRCPWYIASFGNA